FVVWQSPLISVGHDTFLADALRAAGAESVIQTRQDWPHVGLEDVVRLQPEYIVFAAAGTGEGPEDLASLRATPVWRELKAVKDAHVIVVSDAINRPAPRLIDAIEDLARQLHPEAFVDAPHIGSDPHAVIETGPRTGGTR
ncbi:MAG: ABC transporter substrate-binding protein, partial [Bryobacteraceae bacterium]